ncbi:hypothetical protein PGTUg99_028049 [Puccinia graminis f. sp. tritici]|nr:hypothetical protein PGTUg99_028049 [Puccinia graminis f. sp. tritici]
MTRDVVKSNISRPNVAVETNGNSSIPYTPRGLIHPLDPTHLLRPTPFIPFPFAASVHIRISTPQLHRPPPTLSPIIPQPE